MTKTIAIEEPPISRGECRTYLVCNICGKPSYRDFTPYALSTPILCPPCGHLYEDQSPISRESWHQVVARLKKPSAPDLTADLLAVLKELMAWHDCLPTRNICDIEEDARRVIAAAEVRS